MDAIRFLEEKGLIKEYLEIPHLQNTVVVEISNRELKNKKSTKFYTAYLNFSKNIASIASKKPTGDHSHILYISANPVTFMKVPKNKWNVDVVPLEMLRTKIHMDIFNKFMSRNCIIESSLRLLLHFDNGKEMVYSNEAMNRDDWKKVKEMLLKQFSGEIKRLGGKNIIVKDVNPFEVNIKYTLPKEILLPMVLLGPVINSPLFPYSIDPCNPYKYVKKGKNKERGVWSLGGSYLIRNEKKGKNKHYFFIDDESEDFDDIVITINLWDFEYVFPYDRQEEFICYITKKIKNAGINKLEICYN